MTKNEIKIIEYLISMKDKLSVFIETKEANTLTLILEEIKEYKNIAEKLDNLQHRQRKEINSLKAEIEKEQLKSYLRLQNWNKANKKIIELQNTLKKFKGKKL